MASLSERLRRERELRGISLRQISEDTKIGVRFLEALEENKIELIPGEFYRRSYLRAYARYLGLDEDRALNAYSYSRGDGRPDEGDSVEPSQSAGGSAAWTKWAAGIVVVLLLAAGGLLLRSKPSPSDSGPMTSAPAAIEPADAESPVEASLEERGSPSLAPEEVERDTPPALVPQTPGVETPPARSEQPPLELTRVDPDAPIRLLVAVEETCWLEIEADGIVVASGVKEEGFRQSLSAHNEVRLWLGNAAGVSLWVNERRAKPLGREGQVRKDLTITPANVLDFMSEAEDLS